jgi:hypothetical protein
MITKIGSVTLHLGDCLAVERIKDAQRQPDLLWQVAA